MEDSNIAKCSHDADIISQENSESLSLSVANTSTYPSKIQMPSLQNMKSIDSRQVSSSNNPESPTILTTSKETFISDQPHVSHLHPPLTLINTNQPPSLFLQACLKLSESSRNFSVINYLQSNIARVGFVDWKSGDVTPPDSLTSAPPSYSFVLRQMATRGRPRLMGTFISSPSFVQHTPPPTYATAFDIYFDPGPPPPLRVHNFGFTSMPVICPECGFTGMTVTISKITICTHLCAFILCLFCCWICAPLPYVLRSCKDVYHYCTNCRNYLGMYCPTNTENSIIMR